MEAVHIAANENTVPGDVSAMVPGGIRMGKILYKTMKKMLKSVFRIIQFGNLNMSNTVLYSLIQYDKLIRFTKCVLVHLRNPGSHL